jgi:hypothetical protein
VKPSKTLKLIKALHVNTNTAGDQRVLESLLDTFDEKHKTQSAARQRYIWRTGMRKSITKLAAAAVIIIAVLIGINQFSGPVHVTSVAWGDVRQTFLSQPWVHVKYDNGREEWMNIREGKHFCISEDGWRFLADRATNTRLEYSLNNDHILEFAPPTYPEGNVPPWEPRIAWEVVLGLFEEGEGWSLGEFTDIEKRVDTIDEHDVVRFDIYYLDALNSRVLTTQVWVDPESRFPLRIRKKLPLAVREIKGYDYVIGEYDFPDTGPESIFDLGVPPGLKIVSRADPSSTTSTEVQQILQACEKAAQGFPKRYRAIVCSNRNGEGGEIDVIYRSGEKLHFFHYFNLDGNKYPDCHLYMPATTTEILEWAVNQMPVEVGVFDGVNVFRRFNVHPYVNVHEETSVRVRRASTDFLPPWFYLEDDFWPYVYGKKRSLELIANHPETPPGCVALSDGNVYYFVDPLKDYMSVKEIWTRNENGTQRKISEISLSNFVQLPTRNWYPQKIQPIFHKLHPIKEPPFPDMYSNVDIQLLQEEDLPPGLFDGEKLLEGAEINTY